MATPLRVPRRGQRVPRRGQRVDSGHAPSARVMSRARGPASGRSAWSTRRPRSDQALGPAAGSARARGAERRVLREGRPRCAPDGPPAGGARGAPGEAAGNQGVEGVVSGEVGVEKQGMRRAGAGSGEAQAWRGFSVSTCEWGLRLTRACPPAAKLSVSPGLAGPPWTSLPLRSVTPALPLLSPGKLPVMAITSHPTWFLPCEPVLPGAVWS